MAEGPGECLASQESSLSTCSLPVSWLQAPLVSPASPFAAPCELGWCLLLPHSPQQSCTGLQSPCCCLLLLSSAQLPFIPIPPALFFFFFFFSLSCSPSLAFYPTKLLFGLTQGSSVVPSPRSWIMCQHHSPCGTMLRERGHTTVPSWCVSQQHPPQMMVACFAVVPALAIHALLLAMLW